MAALSRELRNVAGVSLFDTLPSLRFSLISSTESFGGVLFLKKIARDMNTGFKLMTNAGTFLS